MGGGFSPRRQPVSSSASLWQRDGCTQQHRFRHRPKGQSRNVTMGVAAVVGLIVFRGLSALLSSNSSGKSEIALPAASTPMQPENTLRYANGDIFEGNIIDGKANDPQR